MHPHIERYLEAAVAGTPRRDRADVRAELRSAIEESIREQIEAGFDEDTATELTLDEFGDPSRLASRYTARRLGLVSPERYPAWRALVRLLLIVIVPIVFVVFLIIHVENGESLLSALGRALFAALEATVHAAFWTTLGFALADRLSPPTPDTEAEVPWSTAYLPQISASSIRVGTSEAVLWAGAALVAAALLVLQGVIPVASDNGGPIHLLASEGWRFWWPYTIVGLVLIAALVFVVRNRGRWSGPLLAAVVALEAALVAPNAWLLVSGQALEPRFMERLDAWADSLGWGLQTSASDIFVITIVTVLVVGLVWSVIDAARIARRLAEEDDIQGKGTTP